MPIHVVAITITCCFFLVLVQFAATLLGGLATLGVAVIVGILACVALEFFQLKLRAGWILVLAAGTSLTAVALSTMNGALNLPILISSPIVAFASCGLLLLVTQGRHGRCALCNQHRAGAIYFRCPRCHLRVCDQDCWDFENIRCRLCQQNRVQILSPDPRWWDEQLGPRLTQGRCQLCLASCLDADLRACPHCGRSQCRSCWDAANGRCTHCRYLIAALPPELRLYLELPSTGSAGISNKVNVDR